MFIQKELLSKGTFVKKLEIGGKFLHLDVQILLFRSWLTFSIFFCFPFWGFNLLYRVIDWDLRISRLEQNYPNSKEGRGKGKR